MAKSRVAILGKNRLAEELFLLCQEKGLSVTRYAEADRISAPPDIAVDTLARPEENKRLLIQKWDAALEPDALILTSCLGFSVTRIASWTRRPERVIGFATFYPVRGKKMIELSRGLCGAESFAMQAADFFAELGKSTAAVKDSPGLVFPRILSAIINEAARCLDEGVASAEEIDQAMKLGVNYPLGPLAWADEIGLDEILAVLEGQEQETGDDRYRPAPLLQKMVLAGRTGAGKERGFYRP